MIYLSHFSDALGTDHLCSNHQLDTVSNGYLLPDVHLLLANENRIFQN